jgi:hypothetical protein
MGFYRYYFILLFIYTAENYIHEDSYAISTSHYGKKQSTLLVATVHYINDKGERTTRYFDFVSTYLSHNFLFYDKSYEVLVKELKELIPRKFTRIINITDGGNHFISKYAFWNLGEFACTKGNNNN